MESQRYVLIVVKFGVNKEVFKMLFSVWFLTIVFLICAGKSLTRGAKMKMQQDLETEKFLADPDGYQPPGLEYNLEVEERIYHNLQYQILCNAIVTKYSGPYTHRFSWKKEYTQRCTRAGVKKAHFEPPESWAPEINTPLWKEMKEKMLRIQAMDGYEDFAIGKISSVEFEKMQGTKMEFM